MESYSNKFLRLILAATVVIILLVFGRNVSFAALCDIGSVIGPDKTLNPNCIPQGVIVPDNSSFDIRTAIPDFLKSSILPFLGLAAVVMLVYSGFKLAMAFGNEKAFGEAKDAVKHVVTGFILAIFAYAIIVALVRLIFE